MDVPEIRLYVAQYLNKAQLAAAAVVFGKPQVTREDEAGSLPETHKLRPRYDTENPRLTSLKICFEDYRHVDPVPSEFVDVLSKSFPRLKSFHLHDGTYRSQDIGLLFREICESLDEMSLHSIALVDRGAVTKKTKGDTKADSWLPHEFPKLKTLSLRLQMSLSQQLALIEKCTRLRSLKWGFPERANVSTTTELSRILTEKCSPVVELDIANLPLRDQELAKMIEAIQPGLCSISLSRTSFGPTALKPLMRQHAASLTYISLESEIFTATSAMVQKILTSCHQLTEIYADILKARDILGIAESDSKDDEDEDEEGEEEEEEEEGEEEEEEEEENDWVCTKLKTFQMFICGLRDKPTDWHQDVFKQISKLELLEELYVSPRDSFKDKTPPYIFKNEAIWDGLDIQLRAGLDNLSNLKHLKTLSFSYLGQELDKKDICWMVKSWPVLEEVYGEFSEDKKWFKELATILETRGIETTVDDGPDSDEEQDFDKFEALYWRN
ncbi:hypothetical protein BGX26_005718 [Mortierella sp. AD094]|nr:hypothetical protein BGX26_005718 [Mortierella sp. AD094]